MTTYKGVNFSALKLLLPILSLLDGYAVQNEQIVSFSMDQGEVVEVRFPAMVFFRVAAQKEKGGYAWVLEWASGQILTVIVPN